MTAAQAVTDMLADEFVCGFIFVHIALCKQEKEEMIKDGLNTNQECLEANRRALIK